MHGLSCNPEIVLLPDYLRALAHRFDQLMDEFFDERFERALDTGDLNVARVARGEWQRLYVELRQIGDEILARLGGSKKWMH